MPEAVAQEPEQVPGEAPEAALSTPPPPKEPGAQEEGSPGVGGGQDEAKKMSDGFSDTEDGREAQAHVWTGEQVGGKEHNCQNAGFVGRGMLLHNPHPQVRGARPWRSGSDWVHYWPWMRNQRWLLLRAGRGARRGLVSGGAGARQGGPRHLSLGGRGGWCFPRLPGTLRAQLPCL